MRSEALAWLGSLSEKDLYPLLQELLYAMGFKRVAITHGQLEYGRDLVFMEIDKLGRETWYGLQAKAGRVGGSLASEDGLRSIINQCEAALDTEYKLPSGEILFLKEIWLACTFPLTEQAKASISGKMNKRPPLAIIDGPHLAELLVTHLPNLMQAKSRPVEKYLDYLLAFCDSIDDYIKIRLSSRFNLHDVYVEQTVKVRLLPPNRAENLKPLDREIDIDFITSNLKTIAALGVNRLLPAALHLRLTDILTRIDTVLHAVASMHWLTRMPVYNEHVSSISKIIGTEPFGTRQNPSSDSDYKYECRANAELFKNIEKEIVAWGSSSEEQFPKIASLIEHSFSPKAKPDNPIVRLARNQFFHSLELYYKSAIDLDQEWTLASHHIGDLLAAQPDILPIHGSALKKNTERLEHLVHDCRLALKECHASLLDQLKTLWLTLGDIKATPLRELSDDRIDALVKTEQISRLLDGAYNLDKDAYLELSFSAFELCESVPRLILLGDLGVGKSTLIKQLAKRVAEGLKEAPSGLVPVVCRLASVPEDADSPLNERLADWAESRFSELVHTFEERTWWFLDGFDEVQSSTIKNEITDWTGNPKIRFTLTSRPFALSRLIPDTMSARVVSFSELQIEEFVDRFPWNRPEDKNKFLQSLKSAPELLKLAQTPLLLTLIVVIAQAQGPERLPKRREGLYNLIIDLFMGDWDIAKGLRRSHAVVDEQLRSKMLRRAAYNLYLERKRSFTREEFADAILKVGGPQSLNVDEAIHFFFDLLRDCLIVPLSRDKFGFFHLSIHEYLAALDLCDDTTPIRFFSAFKDFFRSGGWWEEVLVFYAAVKRDIAPVLEDLHTKSFPSSTSEGLNPDFLRILQRMLDAADFTNLLDISPKGVVAQAFQELNIGQQAERWRRFAQASSQH